MPAADTKQLARAVLDGDRAALARAITLVESARADHAEAAQELLGELLPHTGGAHRIGVSGVPGVGKSTFIEALGVRLVEAGLRVAVLAVDPSSSVSGGSILGDKSRMHRLAREQSAFIRPSPSATSLGGVARRTRETLLLCEAAGYDVVLVETVGVGQSETEVAAMVDSFLVLLLPGAGDELQGIKKGILELADLVCVHKADGDNVARAREAATEVSSALRYARPRRAEWRPPVSTASSVSGEGLDELWRALGEHRAALESAGELDELRAAQAVRWMWREVEEGLLSDFRAHPAVVAALAPLEAEVRGARLPTARAAARLLDAYRDGRAR